MSSRDMETLLALLLDCVGLHVIQSHISQYLFYFILSSSPKLKEALLSLTPRRKCLALVSINIQRRRPINKTFCIFSLGLNLNSKHANCGLRAKCKSELNLVSSSSLVTFNHFPIATWTITSIVTISPV